MMLRVVRHPSVFMPLAVSAVAMMIWGYNDIRDRLDPTRVERQVIDDNVGKVFGREHIQIRCGEPPGPNNEEVQVSAELKPGGFVSATEQTDKTNITISLSTGVCKAVVSYNKDPNDPGKILKATGPLLQILTGVDRAAGVNPDPDTEWYWEPDDLPYPVTDPRNIACHAPQALISYMVIAGTRANTAARIGKEQATALGVDAATGVCEKVEGGDMHLSELASSTVVSR